MSLKERIGFVFANWFNFSLTVLLVGEIATLTFGVWTGFRHWLFIETAAPWYGSFGFLFLLTLISVGTATLYQFFWCFQTEIQWGKDDSAAFVLKCLAGVVLFFILAVIFFAAYEKLYNNKVLNTAGEYSSGFLYHIDLLFIRFILRFG